MVCKTARLALSANEIGVDITHVLVGAFESIYAGCICLGSKFFVFRPKTFIS